MLTNLAWKELRELAPLVIGALLLQFCLVAVPSDAWWLQAFVSYESRGSIPFVSDTLSTVFFIVAGAAAMAIGMSQTFAESGRSTFQFLLHRPATRETLLLHKLVVGATASLVVAAFPVTAYALWAAAPGTHASPFAWSMTAWAFEMLVAVPLLYLGAFLSGLRPGRLLGSRLFPLAAAVLLYFFLQFPMAPRLLWLALTVLIEAIYLAVILNVGETRDYS